MKKKLKVYFVTTLLLFNHVLCQTTDINKFESDILDNLKDNLTSIYGVQFGISGINLHKEIPISNSIVLRPEVGLEFGYLYSSGFDLSIYTLTPKLELGSKWYYNINNRIKKNKKTSDNAFNYFSLSLSYLPDWFVISNYNISGTNNLSIIPTWGIRRNFGKKFNYEFNVGYSGNYLPDFKVYENNLYLDFKVGYKFK